MNRTSLLPQSPVRRWFSTGRNGPGSRLAMTHECVCAVAEKHGLDISGFDMKIDEACDRFMV
jgi:hypothetical protein